jgi:uncharacterized Zn finger protein (UPF0148 family)
MTKLYFCPSCRDSFSGTDGWVWCPSCGATQSRAASCAPMATQARHVR